MLIPRLNAYAIPRLLSTGVLNLRKTHFDVSSQHQHTNSSELVLVVLRHTLLFLCR